MQSNLNDRHHRAKTRLKQALSSSGGALITALVVTPFDVIKIRLQAQTHQFHKGDCFVYRNGLMDTVCTCMNGSESWYNRKIPGGSYKGTVDAFVKIMRYEGPTSLWSGLQPTLIMSFPSVVLYFTAYEEAKSFFGYHEIRNPNTLLPVVSGALARFLSVSFVSPLELIRTKMQSEKLNYSQIGNVVKKSIKNHGFMSMYRGLVPTLWRDIPFSMIYWFTYESLKTLALNNLHAHATDAYTPALSASEIFLSGAIAGTAAATVTCPFDVVKTHRQVQLGELDMSKTPRRTVEIMRNIYNNKGIKGLFVGLLPRTAKVATSCAIMITSFEFFKIFFRLNE